MDKNYALTLMPHKGSGWAYFFIRAGETLHLLNALTAYKLEELGLIRASSAHNPGNKQQTTNHALTIKPNENAIYAQGSRIS